MSHCGSLGGNAQCLAEFAETAVPLDTWHFAGHASTVGPCGTQNSGINSFILWYMLFEGILWPFSTVLAVYFFVFVGLQYRVLSLLFYCGGCNSRCWIWWPLCIAWWWRMKTRC